MYVPALWGADGLFFVLGSLPAAIIIFVAWTFTSRGLRPVNEDAELFLAAAFLAIVAMVATAFVGHIPLDHVFEMVRVHVAVAVVGSVAAISLALWTKRAKKH